MIEGCARRAAAALLACALLCLGALGAGAREVTVRGAEAGRYGRILLEFDQATRVTARAANGILVISFAEPVTIKAERLAAEMPGYVSIVRRDPDRTGLRVALAANFRPNVLEAGEKVFIDLLPEGWTGLPPGLPQDVVAELARRAREAEARMREDVRKRRTEAPRPLTLRVARIPTLTRVMIEPLAGAPASFKASGTAVELFLDAPLALDPAAAKGQLAGVVSGVQAEAAEGALLLRMTLEPGFEARGFREDEAFVIDIARPRAELPGAEGEDARAKAEPARPEPGRAGGARPEPAKPEPAKSGAVKPEPARTEPAKAEPAKPEPARTEPSKPDQARAAEPSKPPHPASRAPDQAPAGPVRPVASVGPGGLSVAFPFRGRTPAALFERGGVVTAVFHSPEPLEMKDLPPEAARYVQASEVAREGAFAVVRLTLARPEIASLTPQGSGWTLAIGSRAGAASEPLQARRSVADTGLGTVEVPLAGASGVHWMDDPTGERIAVVTSSGPPQAVPKLQRFVEFRLLPTAHGVAVAADADDLIVRSGVDGASVSRGTGLALSAVAAGRDGDPASPAPLDPVIVRDRWIEAGMGNVRERLRGLMQEAADAPRSGRSAARLELARAMMANGLDHEAGAVLAYAVQEDLTLARHRPYVLLAGISAARRNRPAETRRLLAADFLAEDPEAVLWRAVADAREGRWPAALAGFRRTAAVIDLYPDDVQAPIRLLAVRAALLARDFGYADIELSMLAGLDAGLAARNEAMLLKARLDEASGRGDVALDAFRHLAETAERPVAAEAALHWVRLARAQGTMGEEEAIARLETLSVVWRGDEVEIGTVGELGALYARTGRWRDAFTMARRANRIFPDHPITRTLHDSTARLFEELFLAGRGDTLSRVDSLALYFDFKEFTPIGRRGDEIVRRLADRLVELDLLDQAGELLQHQVERRLTGAAQATVAARLAAVRLMDGRPAQALAAIQQTRLPELPAAINRARLLLEARALSDLSRTDLALEVLQGEAGPDVDRLRADILWSGRRWREAGEAHEFIAGTRWQGQEPLGDRDRTDVMRAAIAYSLAEDPIAIGRLRQKFAGKMADSADARVFAFLTRPGAADTRAFREMARSVSSADTLADFLSEYRKRYPEASVAERPRREGGSRGAEPRAEAGAGTPPG